MEAAGGMALATRKAAMDIGKGAYHKKRTNR
jgi:hypothetical protein